MKKAYRLPVGIYRAASKREAYRAVITKDKVVYHLGTFPTVDIARAAYTEAKVDPAAWKENRLEFMRRHDWTSWYRVNS